MDEPIESLYFNWLVGKVSDPHAHTPSQTHWNLLRELQNTEFVWTVARDDNRAEDGVGLRGEFLLLSQLEAEPEWLDIPCSIFEMIYGLSRRASFEDGRHPYEWFWEIMQNLELADYTDAYTMRPDTVAEVLYRLVWRQYEPNGVGGMFPIQDPRTDQRTTEIWYQLEGYLAEREYAGG